MAHAGVGGSPRGGVFFPKMFQGWGGVGHVGVGLGGSCRGRVGWGGSCRGGWVM